MRVKENFEISLLEQMDEYTQRLSRDRRVRENNQRFAILRCYCHLIDQINMFSQTLGKDGKFQLFICLALRWIIISITLVVRYLITRCVKHYWCFYLRDGKLNCQLTLQRAAASFDASADDRSPFHGGYVRREFLPEELHVIKFPRSHSWTVERISYCPRKEFDSRDFEYMLICREHSPVN